jgi:hypothetical protein
MRLTDRLLATGVTLNDLVHIVKPYDTTDSPEGSSYKANIRQVLSYNTFLEPTLAMPIAVGGIPAGTTVTDLYGDTFIDLFNELLFPTVQPTYTIPTISIGGVSNSIAEVGSTISLSLTATGVKNDAGVFTQLQLLRDNSVIFTSSILSVAPTTNVPNQFGYANPNNPNQIYTIVPTPYLEVFTLPAPLNSNTFTTTVYNSRGSYDAGLPKQGNKGSVDSRLPLVRNVNAPQAGSTSYNSVTYTYTNIYPYFWGVSSTQPTPSGIAALISSGAATKELSSAASTIIINFNASSPKYLWFATFSNYPAKTKWFVDALNSGSIGGFTNLFQSPVTTSINSPSGYWSGINFGIYISNYQTTMNSIQLRNS